MNVYACLSCGKRFKKEELDFIRCPYCGGKVFFKETPQVAKKVKTD
ncbi:DNA-directed RNA polymerase subunit P [Candidatus Micrarchaeota archaeon]|nr:DNA-directed RNA polymerase subunit P [Candidatus Micrarchaeota archaeon]